MPKKGAAPVFRVCFVCTGNICRSPMAEIILRDMAEQRGLHDDLEITSAGTGEWHVGEQADPRTRDALERVGYSGDAHRAKQFDPDSFDRYDLLVTFDRGQRRILRSWAESDEQRALIRPLLSFTPEGTNGTEVPDPYYGDDELFDEVRDVIIGACEHLLDELEPVIRAARDAAPPRTNGTP